MSTILITSAIEKQIEATLTGGTLPSPGVEFELTKTDTVSYMQHRLFHPLVQEWFKSDMYPYKDIKDWWSLRQLCKFKFGNGFGSFVYVDWNYSMIEVYDMKDIPDDIYLDYLSPDKGGNGNHSRIQGKLQSLTTYKKSEMTSLIDNTIRAMLKSGVDTTRFFSILEKIDFKA